MSHRTRCTLSAFCLSLVLCLPLHGHTGAEGKDDTLSGFFSVLWERLSTPLASLWAADETDERSTIDPLGGTETTDGRGAADPDGLN